MMLACALWTAAGLIAWIEAALKSRLNFHPRSTHWMWWLLLLPYLLMGPIGFVAIRIGRHAR